MKQTRGFWLTLSCLIIILVTLACAQTNTFAALNIAQTWTALQTFGSGTLAATSAVLTTPTITSPSISNATMTTPNIGVASGTSLNLGATGTLSTTAQSGTGSIAMTNSAVLTTPNIGAATTSSLTFNSDPAMTNSPRMVMVIPDLLASPDANPAIFWSMRLDKNIQILRIDGQYANNVGPSGCAPFATYSFANSNLANFSNIVMNAAETTATFSNNYTAGNLVTMAVTNLASGCGVAGASPVFTITYVMR